MVALFPEDLTRRHYRGAVDVCGVQEAYDAGHEPRVQVADQCCARGSCRNCLSGAGTPECPGGEFGPVCQLQLGQDASHMSLDGPFGEHQLGGNRAVGDPG
jgi:hypothetical protein